MATRYHRQASRVRIPLWWIQLALLIASAAVVALGVWFAFALLTSMQQYVPMLP